MLNKRALSRPAQRIHCFTLGLWHTLWKSHSPSLQLLRAFCSRSRQRRHRLTFLARACSRSPWRKRTLNQATSAIRLFAASTSQARRSQVATSPEQRFPRRTFSAWRSTECRLPICRKHIRTPRGNEPKRPNQAIELTATRRVFTFQMTKSLSLRATLALSSGSWSCSR